MTKPPRNSGDYEVGYGKPPAATRFVKGVSGNPGGRPKGRRIHHITPEPLDSLLQEEAYRQIKVREGDKVKTMPALQAVIRGMLTGAAKGNPRQQRQTLEMIGKVEGKRYLRLQETIDAAITYKLTCDDRRQEAAAAGLPPPEFLPDPDDIVFEEGRVVIKGPITSSDKVHFDQLRQLKSDLEEELAHLQRDLGKNGPDPILERERDRITQLIDKIKSRGL